MQPGDEIDGYRFEAKLGEGGMGEVWRARPLDQKVSVAIKLLLAEYSSNRDLVARFLREANLELDHPNIVRVHKLVTIQGRPGFVMPLYTGGSLEQRIRPNESERAGKPLPFAQVFSISRDILSGLNYAHTSGYIHCDVKPSNILFDAGGRAYVTDFGIALEIVRIDLTMRGVIGTPEYMSPEQIKRKANGEGITHLTDVYSYGCCLYDMLTGRPPFDLADADGSPFTVQEKHVREDPPKPSRWNPGIPALLEQVVLESLAKDPNDRIPGCQEFVTRLDAVEKELLREQYRDPPPKQGRRTLIAATVLGGTVVTLAAAYKFWPASKPPIDGRSTVNQALPARAPSLPTVDPAPPVRNQTPPIVDPTPPVHNQTQPTVDPTPPVRRPAPPVRDRTPPTVNPAPPVRDQTPPTVNPTPLVRGPTPTVNPAPPVRDVTPPTVNPAQPMRDQTPPTVNPTPPGRDVTPTTVNPTPSVRDVTPPTVNPTSPVREATSPRPNPVPPDSHGTMTWTGSLVKNTKVDITSSSTGQVQGSLPGVAVYIETDPRDLEIVEQPSPSNGFRRIVVRSKRDRREVKIFWRLSR